QTDEDSQDRDDQDGAADVADEVTQRGHPWCSHVDVDAGVDAFRRDGASCEGSIHNKGVLSNSRCTRSEATKWPIEVVRNRMGQGWRTSGIRTQPSCSSVYPCRRRLSYRSRRTRLRSWLREPHDGSCCRTGPSARLVARRLPSTSVRARPCSRTSPSSSH